MSSSKISFLLFSLCSLMMILLISDAPMTASASESGSGESLYERVCREGYPNRTQDCLQVLEGDSRIPTATNFVELSNFILDFALKNGVEGQSLFSDLGEKNPSSQAINKCGKVCYPTMVAAFKGAKSELKKQGRDHSTGSARYQTAIATDYSKKCGNAIQREKIANPEIDDINNIMSILCDAAFIAIVDINKKSK